MLGGMGRSGGSSAAGGARQGESRRTCKQGESRAVSGVRRAACALHPAATACTFSMPACTLLLHLTSCTLHPRPEPCTPLLHSAFASCTFSVPCLLPVPAISTAPSTWAPCPLPAPALSMQLGHYKPLGSGGSDLHPGHSRVKGLRWKQNPAQLGWSPHKDETLCGSPSEAALMTLTALMSSTVPAICSCISASSSLNFHCSPIISPIHSLYILIESLLQPYFSPVHVHFNPLHLTASPLHPKTIPATEFQMHHYHSPTAPSLKPNCSPPKIPLSPYSIPTSPV